MNVRLKINHARRKVENILPPSFFNFDIPEKKKAGGLSSRTWFFLKGTYVPLSYGNIVKIVLKHLFSGGRIYPITLRRIPCGNLKYQSIAQCSSW